MKLVFLKYAFCALLALPVQAEVKGAPAEVEESAPFMFDLFDRMLRSFITEVEPHMRELERGFTALEPELQRFLQNLRDMTHFYPPEILPNGDVLIRRRHVEDEGSKPESDAAEESSAEPFEL